MTLNPGSCLIRASPSLHQQPKRDAEPRVPTNFARALRLRTGRTVCTGAILVASACSGLPAQLPPNPFDGRGAPTATATATPEPRPTATPAATSTPEPVRKDVVHPDEETGIPTVEVNGQI